MPAGAGLGGAGPGDRAPGGAGPAGPGPGGLGLAGLAPGGPGLDFVSAVLEVVDSIPPGTVMAYGEVAAAIGSRAARAVGTVMARYGSDHPWWRVVRASGHPPIDHEASALEHYRAEGTPLTWSRDGTYRVALPSARHRP